MSRIIQKSWILGLFLLVSTEAQAADWGEFKADHCTQINHRQYSAILWNIPWWQTWEDACRSTPATINGHYFKQPTRCVNTGTNMWGEFDVPDSSCPHWGVIDHDGCYSHGVRQYSSILWDIPWGYSWETACANEPATIAGQYFSSPSQCVNTGINMRGQFRVNDASCTCSTYWEYGQCQSESYCRYVQKHTCISQKTWEDYNCAPTSMCH